MGSVFTSDGQRLFVWDKAGRVWVSSWNGVQYVKQATPVLDISEEVGNWRDFGLASLCLDPNFASNGLIYLYYMVDRHHLLYYGTPSYSSTKDEYYNASISRLTRYKLTTTNSVLSVDISSRKVLLGETKSTGVPLTHESHAGGTILFGTDGTLFVSTGDNASYASYDKGSASETYWQTAINDGILRANENVGAFRAQMITSLCGKILRLDPNTGDGVASNPFYNTASPRAAASRVWTLGFRNPFRMGIQPGTGSTNPADGNPGTLLVGDVGMDTWEDMHIIRQAGENAGWPLFEGLEENSNYATISKTLENRDEPNPTNTCQLPYLRFGDLLKQATNPTTQVTNPCSQQPLSGLQRRYVHARPYLDWKHGTDIARVPAFSGSTATTTTIGATGPTIGTPFRGNSSTAGAYYTGTAFPAAYRNTYYFADYGANWIKAATFNTDGSLKEIRNFLPSGVGKGIVDVEYNPLDGALYYVNINTGELMKISFGGNQPPVAVISADKTKGTSPLTVQFKGDGSSDSDGDVLTYAWDFGDGTKSTIANPAHTFSGTTTQGFTVKLTVTDTKGLTASQQLVISINNAAPTVKITNPISGSLYPLNRESIYQLKANVTDESVNNLQYSWQVTLRHNNHQHVEPAIASVSPNVNISPVGCDGNTYYYLITVRVTDNGGLTAMDSVKIYPDCATLNLAVQNFKGVLSGVTSAGLTWNYPTAPFDEVLVAARAGSSFLDRPSGTSYTANSDFSGNGTAIEGGKVVYRGLANAVTVTNLSPLTTYYFRVYTRAGNVWSGGVEVSLTTGLADPSACYRLVSVVSGKVLGVENGLTDDGAAIKQRTDANQAWQQWKLTELGNGYYRVTANHSGKTLDVSGGSIQDFAQVTQWTYAGQNNQQWAIQRDNQGYYQLITRHSGKLLDVQSSNQNEGGAVGQYTANGTQAQQWKIEQRTCVNKTPVSLDASKCYRITSRVSGKVLGIDGGTMTDGAKARQRTNANKMWQQWRIQPAEKGFFQLIALHSSKLLTVADVSQEDFASLIQQSTGNGVTNQHWTVERNTEGYYSFTARHSGRLMDLNSSSLADGATINQYMPNGTQAQQWRVEEATCSTNNSARLSTDADAQSEYDSETFRLWPNPAQHSVSIDLRSAQGQPTIITVLDIMGKVMQQVQIDTSSESIYQLDASAFSNGQYLVRINVDNQHSTLLRLLINR